MSTQETPTVTIKRKTVRQAWELARANKKEKLALFIKFGFTKAEATNMIKGGSSGRPFWTVDNTGWYQAISEEHALKLHMWVFGCEGQSTYFL